LCSVDAESETLFVSVCGVQVENNLKITDSAEKNFFTYSIFEHCIRVELLCNEGLPPYFEF
jgi:hypothetical protein